MIKKIIEYPGWTALGTVVAILALLSPTFGAIYCVPKSEEFRQCRSASHGVERYENTQQVYQQSGWRSGGGGQEAFCEEVRQAKEAAIKQSIVWEKAVSGESDDWRDVRHRVYNYHCSIVGHWGPIYKAGRSADCGRTEGVSGDNQLLDQCPYDGALAGIRFFGIRWVGWPFI